MERESETAISLLAEFRLRRWARVHYVPSHQRKESWNPIVLDEMRIKDQEMENTTKENSMKARVSSMYVPLAPDVTSRIDEAHNEISTPHILKIKDAPSRQFHSKSNELVGE